MEMMLLASTKCENKVTKLAANLDKDAESLYFEEKSVKQTFNKVFDHLLGNNSQPFRLMMFRCTYFNVKILQ